ncbi:transglycosylase SLT domain-containing protein [Bacillus thuringiensis]|uniref:lytic transglycosylase domain-containing protein n=1 Tax=Bacillus thuringiensis TaxID=1428 RepID=UPI0007C1D88C|nr:lytic transglycosylase domain-containing protein [Bacillus thuringiensis]AND07248.1 lytic transglycosylase [Bacillus thuringiensis serovar alesti]MEC3597556.1 transglycosylase SLT domain-containing protein [Bacillus thuringiensis]MED1836926.1 transglycosylase SLT domain-containing protein [Bacillus thuringiensis]MED2208983.1 transglycosylase SLT domain-containing protein [Bacillus thuringiensis]MED2666950.1 transglycosylase SLT domain-containing protein [Bacillus thuringiensis]
MLVGNIVKEVLAYKKGQIQQKLSSPQAFVSSRFQEKLQSEPARETKATTQPAKIEDMSQPEQSTKIETVVNKPEQSINKVDEASKPEEKGETKKVDEASKPEEKGETKKADEVQVAQKEFERRFPETKNEAADTWGLTKKYNIQKIRSSNEGKYEDIIDRVSRTYGIPKTLIQKMIEVESNFNPKTVSHAGAMGLMQLMPANVKEMGVKNPFSPAESIEGGVKELSGYLKKNNGDLVLALASYNAGSGNVRKYGGVPPFKETQGYIKKILNIDVSK